MLISPISFLSHLSGDEEIGKLLTGAKGFLSHLSGDEVRKSGLFVRKSFLSHLSGDEVLLQKKAD